MYVLFTTHDMLYFPRRKFAYETNLMNTGLFWCL